MWSSGGPNCSEQASPALKEWAQKRPTVTYRSLSATPLSEWTIAFLSHFRGGRVARLVWTVANVQRLVLCSFSFHSVPRWTSQGMFYSLQSSSQRHGSESLSHSSDLFSISRVTREDLLTSFQKWRCLRLTAWLLTLASENSTKNRDVAWDPLLPSRQVTGLRLRRRLGPSSVSKSWKHKTFWLFFFRYIFPPCEASEHRKAILRIDSETDQCACV